MWHLDMSGESQFSTIPTATSGHTQIGKCYIMCVQAGLQVLCGAGGQAGEQARATSTASSAGQDPPIWAISAKQLKAFLVSPRPAKQLPFPTTCWETPYLCFQNAPTPPSPPLGSALWQWLLAPSPSSPRGMSPAKGTDCNFFLLV